MVFFLSLWSLLQPWSKAFLNPSLKTTLMTCRRYTNQLCSSYCEKNLNLDFILIDTVFLWLQKFDDGTITVKEFLKIFNIDFVIHNPRQSILPDRVNALSKYEHLSISKREICPTRRLCFCFCSWPTPSVRRWIYWKTDISVDQNSWCMRKTSLVSQRRWTGMCQDCWKKFQPDIFCHSWHSFFFSPRTLHFHTFFRVIHQT